MFEGLRISIIIKIKIFAKRLISSKDDKSNGNLNYHYNETIVVRCLGYQPKISTPSTIDASRMNIFIVIFKDKKNTITT